MEFNKEQRIAEMAEITKMNEEASRVFTIAMKSKLPMRNQNKQLELLRIRINGLPYHIQKMIFERICTQTYIRDNSTRENWQSRRNWCNTEYPMKKILHRAYNGIDLIRYFHMRGYFHVLENIRRYDDGHNLREIKESAMCRSGHCDFNLLHHEPDSDSSDWEEFSELQVTKKGYDKMYGYFYTLYNDMVAKTRIFYN